MWKSNPPFDPRRAESPALKAGKVTGPLSPPLGEYHPCHKLTGTRKQPRKTLSSYRPPRILLQWNQTPPVRQLPAFTAFSILSMQSLRKWSTRIRVYICAIRVREIHTRRERAYPARQPILPPIPASAPRRPSCPSESTPFGSSASSLFCSRQQPCSAPRPLKKCPCRAHRIISRWGKIRSGNFCS